MYNKKLKLLSLAMAVSVFVSSPAVVTAEDIQEEEIFAGEQNIENEEIYEEEIPGDEIFPGEQEIAEDDSWQEEEFACGVEEALETVLQGTGDLDGTQILNGTQEVAFNGNTVQDALNRAESYLQRTVTSPNVNTSGGEWSVVAMSRGGFLEDSTRNAYLTNLYQTLQENNGVLHTLKYTEYSRVVIALSSLNIDPTYVNGYNLLEPLSDFQKVSGQGINGSIYALIALDTKQYELPVSDNGKVQTTRENLISDILDRELPDGGWTLDGSSADPDITAMVIQCLSPYTSRGDVAAAVDRGIEKLAFLQDENGGYSGDSQTGSGGTAINLESTAQVVIALSSVDVSLIEQERFIKNGKNLLEELLSFQMEDGSFAHVKGGGSDAMATDQGTLALLAWTRAINGQTRLYDMTDQGGPQEELPETQENIEAFRKKMEELPEQVSIVDKNRVYDLKVELDSMRDFEEKEEFDKILQSLIDDITQQENEVKRLDERIWKELNLVQITLKDTEIVKELLSDYQKIPEANRVYLTRKDDLITADTIISKLQEGILAKELFEIIRSSGKDYLYEAEGYTIRIKSSKVKTSSDMRYGIEIKEKDNELFITTEEKETFPGEIRVSVSCTLKDGSYMLFNEHDQEEQWVAVSGKRACFDLLKGGAYILKKTNSTEDQEKMLSGTSKGSSAPAPQKQGGRTAGSRKSANTKEKKSANSNTIDAKVKDGVVEKEQLESIKDKDRNLRIKWKTDKGNEYILTINGKDVKQARNVKVGIKEGSSYQKEIEKLAEKPYVFSFEEQDSFPGKMQVELIVNKEDGKYLLMRYDETERKAEYIQKVKVENKKSKFVVDKGGDYFIAKKVKTKSLNEIENTEYTEKDKEDVMQVEDEILAGTKEESSVPVIWSVGAGILLVVSLAIIIWYFRKKKVDGECK